MEAALEKALANPGFGLLLLNEPNRRYAEDVEQLRQEVSHMEDVWKVESDTNKRSAEYVSDMSQMLDNIQDLVSTLHKDIEAESKHERGAASESEGVVRLCKKRHVELSKINEGSEILENHVTRQQRELEELQKNLSGDSSLLKELLDHLGDLDNDNLLLLQYSAEDASRIKELSVALERCSSEVASAESELSNAQSEAMAAQTALDQLGTAFLQAAANRDHLLAQWEITLNHIYQTANQHTNCIEDSLAAQQKINLLRREVEKENQIQKQVQNSCEEVLRSLRAVEEESTWVNGQHEAVRATKELIQSQLWALQNALSKVNKEIENLRVQLSEQRTFREEKESYLKSTELKCKKSDEKLTLNTELVISVEESLHSLEAMLKDAESLAKGLIRQKERVKEAELHHEKAVAMWKEQEASVKGEITALHAAKARNLKYIKELDGRAVKQREVLHDQELNMQQLRRRIHELTHDSNNNEVDSEQQNQLKLLEQRLQETSTSIKILAKQLTVLKNARTREQTNVSRLEKEEESLMGEVAAIKMSSNSAERECIKMKGSCEELMVDVSLTQLHLQRRMGQLQTIMNKASRLSDDKTDMENMMSEQMQSVKQRVEDTDTHIKSLNSEMHKLSLQLHEVTSRIIQLKDKYVKIKSSLDTPEGEDEVSTTQVFLKVATERAGLQETGDLLDLEVRRAEEEVDALQQMVALLSIEGQQYRSQLHHILHHSEEQQERVLLEESLGALEDDIMVGEAMLLQAQNQLKSTRARLHEVELQVHAVKELLREKNIHMTAVQRETENQHTKACHASKAADNIKWKTRGKSMMQNDIELRLAQERLRMINSLLGDAVSSHPEASEAVVIYCQQVNVPPPDVTKLTKKESFGSRSSIGTLHSSRSSGSSRARSISPGMESWKSRSRRSSLSSLHSEDSGRSASPPHPSVRTMRSSTDTQGVTVVPASITVMTPVFPAKEMKRKHYQGKKLSRRPTQHL